MAKKLGVLFLVATMLFGIFSFTACNNDTLDAYKTAGKTAIETYAQERKDNYCEDNWTVVCGIVEVGKQAVDAAENKPTIDVAVSTAKEEIRAVQANNTFPSILENFNLEEFTDEFFENSTLILVPFEWSYLLYEHLDFYTAFVENGKLKFLIEVTDPYGLGDTAIDMRVFAVIVSNAIFNGLEVGEIRVFEAYDFSGANPTKNSRDLLSEAERKSVKHRVSLLPSEAKTYSISETTAISSRESLREYFSI